MYNPDWLRYCKRVVRAGLGYDHLLRPDRSLDCVHIGSDYGGWVVATARLARTASPVVLSFGLGDDISFDETVCADFGAKVYGFDLTPVSLNWIATRNIPAEMEIFPIGIACVDGKQTFAMPTKEERGNYSVKTRGDAGISCDVMRYNSILAMLKLHRVDILKLDVEGSEYDVIPEILDSPVRPIQLLVEFHHRVHNIHVNETLAAVGKIRQAGYFLFSVSSGGREMSFAR